MVDNPPAFPVELGFGLEPGKPSQTGEFKAQYPGMTLRDWFAGQALASVLANAQAVATIPEDERKEGWASMATILYEMADAMLAERGK